jgi:hypothetical protein
MWEIMQPVKKQARFFVTLLLSFQRRVMFLM